VLDRGNVVRTASDGEHDRHNRRDARRHLASLVEVASEVIATNLTDCPPQEFQCGMRQILKVYVAGWALMSGVGAAFAIQLGAAWPD
jgi:hypothetical protein